ncbi:MAG: Na(+)/H(+) antiporter subunit B [Acidobacteria bacterium]|nr:MAG: Na(+)/H(+) antiporter subunit B [Acidobacteriota bacterium]REK10598.1 MAG: Na(+)/H(+) antiporter subunit B [Acidobacteriota bacterium]
MREQIVLQVGGRLLTPFILLFALYVQFHGDFGPGGGFQAGVLFAAALVLFGLLFGVDRVQQVIPVSVSEVMIAVGVLLYAGVGVTTLLLGSAFLDYDALSAEHGQHWGILLVEAGVGIAVAATMTRLYYAFGSLHPDSEPAAGEHGE